MDKTGTGHGRGQGSYGIEPGRSYLIDDSAPFIASVSFAAFLFPYKYRVPHLQHRGILLQHHPIFTSLVSVTLSPSLAVSQPSVLLRGRSGKQPWNAAVGSGSRSLISWPNHNQTSSCATTSTCVFVLFRRVDVAFCRYRILIRQCRISALSLRLRDSQPSTS